MNIGYKLIKNSMPATADKAPYLGMAIPVGSLAYDNILKEMVASGTKMTQPTAKYFLDALYEYAAEKIASDVVRINLGLVSIYPKIEGSFDTEDAAFDPARNALNVGAAFSAELRDRVMGLSPDFAGEASVGTVKLHSCLDLETQTFKVIRGTKAFRLAGANLAVPDGEDESLALYAKNGLDKVADIVVSETDGGQRILCHLSDAAAVPSGTYKVRLASHGLDPTDPLTVVMLSVTLAEAIPEPASRAPTLANAHSPGCDPMSVSLHEDVILDGTNLKGFKRLVAHHEEYAGEIELPTEGATASDDGTQLALPGAVWDAVTAKVSEADMPTRPITFEVITAEGTASISPTVE